MAKKKKETGPGPVMIIFLVFFIMLSAVLGVLVYLGFETEAKLAEEATKAKEDKTGAEKKLAEAEARRNLLRIAVGIEDPQDREDLVGATKEHGSKILEEHERLVSRLKNSFPTTDAFRWELIDDLRAGGTGGGEGKKLAPNPRMSIPSIVKAWAKIAKDEEKKAADANLAKANAEAQRKAAEDRADAQKKTFDTKVTELEGNYNNSVAKLNAAFLKLKEDAEKAGQNFVAKAADWAKEKADLEEVAIKKAADLKDTNDKLRRALSPDPSDSELRFKYFDLTKVEERKGEITDKNGTFVTITFTNRNPLNVGQTFMVLAPNQSLVTVIDREKVLDKEQRERRGLYEREPFSGNEMIKGTIEIVELTGPTSARARIVTQREAIRDPISKKDSVYNVTLSNAGKDHVAYCGIIDLDGDGLPNNEEFVRILEKNNVVVDAYLDLKTGEIKGTGIKPSTKFLILGPDAPEVGKVKDMINMAKDKGVQVIDARKYLKLIGVALPANPFPPRYSTTNIVGDGAAPVAPAEPKKEEAPAPKKDGM